MAAPVLSAEGPALGVQITDFAGEDALLFAIVTAIHHLLASAR